MWTITTSERQLTLRDDETLLDGLLRTGHDVAYQCKSGYCGTCRLRLISGKVSYTQMPMAYIATGEILPCCCRLESDVSVVCHLRDDGTS